MQQIKTIYFTIGIWLLVCGSVKAQNLIPNPSFEDTVHCPTNINQLYNCQLWINSTQGTPDYFNACSTNNSNIAHVPTNTFGYQTAHNGNAYIGIYGYNTFPKNGGREYIQAKLIDSLVAGTKYLVSFYVSLADDLEYSINTLGAYFSKNAVSSSNTFFLPYMPQIQNPSSVPLTDKSNWMLISDTLHAQGGEQYITIGNFLKDSLSDTLYLGQVTGGWKDAYYYIDDISVIDVATIGINQYEGSKMQVNIYPNPANNILYIETTEEQGEIKIIDVLGNEIKSEKINKSLQVDVSSFINGVYFIEIKTSKGILTKKAIITK